ncbi:hypothetical protein [Natrinema sp. SYSU A 869]|uniref:hypothetical protein n=1 Tax=Natrinema sp. SYSU A 869 TaxID=2871694 RepID=UPI001CA469AB|nr:hypothetical protein [Natrinema sp. SYSU A 869]
MTTFVLIVEDGYGCHLESGLQYTTLCGRTFDTNKVERIEYETPESPEHPHATLCFDCSTVSNGGSISPRRRDRHFSRGGQA